MIAATGRSGRSRIVAGVRLPEDLPKIIGHKGQLEEVLINLVRNAIEAMQTNNK
jgi:signal transduction histidine kinase